MDKMTICKTCGAEIASSVKICPKCGTKIEKPLYKKIWFWLLIAVIFLGIVGLNGNNHSSDISFNVSTASKQKNITETTFSQESITENTPIKVEESVVQEETVSKEYQNAYITAETYYETMHMSKADIYDQLTSEYGEGFTADAAQYAVDKLDETADWNDAALQTARLYQDQMNMSMSAIYEQLTSEYGAKFTPEQAQYAINNL